MIVVLKTTSNKIQIRKEGGRCLAALWRHEALPLELELSGCNKEVSAHASQNYELCLGTHGRLPGTL